MIKNIAPFSLFFLFILLTAFKPAASGDEIIGVWLTDEKNGKIEIYKENNRYFGKLIWGSDMYDENGKSKLDAKNPDKELKKRPLEGLVLLKNFEYNGDKEWEGGKIYDPQSGKTYSCVMKLEGEELKVTGYIGFSWIGRTVRWTRIK